jgi:hypothetical protein
MLKAGKNLKCVFKNLYERNKQYVNNLREHPLVNQYISEIKAIFEKSAKRIENFKKETGLPLPPDCVLF